MGFEEVKFADQTISLGGTNKKTGKANPTQVEGYYLSRREVPDAKKKTGVSYLYTFKTAKGVIDVWGKTDLDRKMQSVAPGAMLRVTQNGTRATPNGEMYTYKVEVDASNTIDLAPSSVGDSDHEPDDSYEADDIDAEETPLDEVLPARPRPPQTKAAAPNVAAAQAKLNARRTNAA